jgi:hypothetical protein
MLQLSIITHSITQTEATALAKTMQSQLGPTTTILSIHPYHKFPDSYSINLETIVPPDNPAAIIHQAIALAYQIVSPWLMYYDSDLEKIELIYNESDQTQKRHLAFEKIRWGQISY